MTDGETDQRGGLTGSGSSRRRSLCDLVAPCCLGLVSLLTSHMVRYVTHTRLSFYPPRWQHANHNYVTRGNTWHREIKATPMLPPLISMLTLSAVLLDFSLLSLPLAAILTNVYALGHFGTLVTLLCFTILYVWREFKPVIFLLIWILYAILVLDYGGLNFMAKVKNCKTLCNMLGLLHFEENYRSHKV